MADVGASAWSETDASNNATPPDGWPEGQAASTVNDCARANMGAEKRWWNRSNTTQTTGGTSTAYTLTYSVAAAQYWSGEEFAFIVNATCGASPTLNINGLGAKNIRKFAGGSWTNCVAGDLQANEAVRVYYNSGATTFDIVAQPPVNPWQTLDSQTLTGAGSYSLQSISTSINALQIILDLQPATNNINLLLQFYNSAGTLDSGGTSYFYMLNITANSGLNTLQTATASALLIGNAVSNSSSLYFSGKIDIQNIQGTKYTQCNGQMQWLDQGATLAQTAMLFGSRQANGNITGVKIFASSGNISGRITVFGTSN
jgi:hypothetical protein